MNTDHALGSQWGLHIETPLTLDEPDSHPWDETADLVVVGLGGAGIAAALEGLEHGLSVSALDRYEGGGSSKANGGVIYAGGGTRIQREAGEEDTPEEMYKYLSIEVDGVVGNDTVRRFCEESPATIDWLIEHGAKLNSRVWKEKTSYPPLDYFLYHPDSSLAAPYARRAKPAARGHRGYTKNGKKAWGLGGAIYDPLLKSALERGLKFHKYTEVRQLAVDRQGRVVGVKALQIPTGGAAAHRFGRNIAAAAKWFAVLPPSFPLASLTYAIGSWYLKRAYAIEAEHRQPRWYRARRGVLLSAGGFILNRPMVSHYAPRYAPGLPNGTLGDMGSGIMLGASVEARLDLMDRISAWRFINPPKAWAQGPLFNRNGERFVNETLYGASLGDAVMAQPDGKAWILLDRTLRKAAFAQARDPKILPFQRQVAWINLLFNCKRAPTLDALAVKLGCNAAALRKTVADYNRSARGEADDAYEKRPEEMAEIGTGPYYAIDTSITSRFLPLPTMTIGGLRVEESSGLVQREQGGTIPGLYAAGRNAVGLCSNIYLSGLSYADCIFSGRNVARHVAAQGPTDQGHSQPSDRTREATAQV